jgi:hypothetical protein
VKQLRVHIPRARAKAKAKAKKQVMESMYDMKLKIKKICTIKNLPSKFHEIF